jgi:O-antigen ligase
MTIRRLAWPLALVVGAAIVTVLARTPAALVDDAAPLFQTAMVVAAAASIAYLVWIVPPALTLTAGIVLSPLAGNWGLVGFPSGVSPDRLLLVGGVAVAVLRAHGTRSLTLPRLTATHGVLALVLLYAIVSAAAVGTLYERAGFFHLFDSFGVLPFLLFLVAPLAFRTERSRSILLAGLVGLGAYLGFTALFEAAGVSELVFPRFILDAATQGGGRAYGVFLEPVSNGMGLFACAVASCIAFAAWRSTAARALAAVTAMLCTAGTFFTLERSVWIGAGAGAVVGGVIAAQRTRQWGRALAVGAGLIAGTALIAGIAFLSVPGFSDRVSKRASDQATIWDRQNLATASWNMIEARPLFGFGWSTFERKSLDYFEQSPDFPLNPSLASSATTSGTFSVHNRFLEYAATLGLAGTALWVLGLLLAIAGAVRARGSPEFERWRIGLLPVLIFYLVISNAVPPSLFPTLAVWLWLGVVWSGYPARLRGAH